MNDHESQREDGISLEDYGTPDPSVPSIPPAPPPAPGMPPSEAPDQTAQTMGGDSRPVRDRIVVLGRRRSGKTIFLARIYQSLWNSKTEDIHMRALDGDSHMSLMRIIGTLESGEWPAATGGNSYSSFEIAYKGDTIPLVMLDYPGEVFRRAFVDGIEASDTKELIEHVDRSLGILCLIDPGNLLDGNLEEVADDEFGMVQALDRIRRSDGGVDIPIALVLTKCDLHQKRIKRLGGLRAFVAERMQNVERMAGRFKRFPAAAVRSTTDARDKEVPDMRKPPEGCQEPLLWCIEQIVINKKRKEIQTARAVHEVRVQEVQAEEVAYEIESVRRSRNMWILFIVLGAIAATSIIGWAIYYVSSSTS